MKDIKYIDSFNGQNLSAEFRVYPHLGGYQWLMCDYKFDVINNKADIRNLYFTEFRLTTREDDKFRICTILRNRSNSKIDEYSIYAKHSLDTIIAIDIIFGTNKNGKIDTACREINIGRSDTELDIWKNQISMYLESIRMFDKYITETLGDII